MVDAIHLGFDSRGRSRFRLVKDGKDLGILLVWYSEAEYIDPNTGKPGKIKLWYSEVVNA